MPGWVLLPESIGAQKLHRNNNEILGPQLAFSVATFMFAVTIVLLYLCISATVDSLSAVTETGGAVVNLRRSRPAAHPQL